MLNKPLPYDLDLKNIESLERIKIQYKCPKCGEELNHYGVNEKFCHNCGTELNWGVATNINYYMFKQYLDFKKNIERIAFFNALNNLNHSYKGNTPCFCKAFTKRGSKSWDSIYKKAMETCIKMMEENKNE